MRYTRRNKGKKYAPLRKDDSLEHGAASKVRDRSGFGSNGASVSANGRAGSAVNHVSNHRHNSDPRYSSEENASDAEPPSQGSYVRQQAGGISFICPSAQQCCFSLLPSHIAPCLVLLLVLYTCWILSCYGKRRSGGRGYSIMCMLYTYVFFCSLFNVAGVLVYTCLSLCPSPLMFFHLYSLQMQFFMDTVSAISSASSFQLSHPEACSFTLMFCYRGFFSVHISSTVSLAVQACALHSQLADLMGAV